MNGRRLSWARGWHLLTFVVGAASIVVQLALAVSGAAVLVEDNAPSLGARLAQFFGYFTIQSNLVAAATAFSLVLDPQRDGRIWRMFRVAGVCAMTITGLVHWFLLRPLLDLEGLRWVVDKGLHVVTPALLVVGWLAFGPRPRVTVRALVLAIGWPVAWLVVIMLQAQVSGWYPYPFLNAGQNGVGSVVIVCIGITVLFLVVAALTLLADRKLPPTDANPEPGSPRTR